MNSIILAIGIVGFSFSAITLYFFMAWKLLYGPLKPSDNISA